jgi:hypothetical protein
MLTDSERKGLIGKRGRELTSRTLRKFSPMVDPVTLLRSCLQQCHYSCWYASGSHIISHLRNLTSVQESLMALKVTLRDGILQNRG